MMAFGHGKGKLVGLMNGKGAEFPDPLSIGPTLSMTLAVGGEFFCALALVVGLATRLALTQLIIVMAVAAFMIHGADDFQTKEKALLYFFPFVALIVTGPGRISADYWILKRLAGRSDGGA
jgi:putative oxidoreductase